MFIKPNFRAKLFCTHIKYPLSLIMPIFVMTSYFSVFLEYEFQNIEIQICRLNMVLQKFSMIASLIAVWTVNRKKIKFLRFSDGAELQTRIIRIKRKNAPADLKSPPLPPLPYVSYLRHNFHTTSPSLIHDSIEHVSSFRFFWIGLFTNIAATKTCFLLHVFI